ncbi:hypothetical protein QBC33DRAFT_240565 [Phialemonium atrogriseum]|uniref:Uncharacterized protein n=1 Tax=Phialemonium atrogriseum TaxID=1093897 RepID=A0AAJ0BSM8_9PEZI|nr:uncharacterized protein QBC33DRAFT_240565 [Phialemonium atrogriseum]KAK1763555.1 hypothetical protein QBC33DRAFT_240565 [Phialemonium atrogriseum]
MSYVRPQLRIHGHRLQAYRSLPMGSQSPPPRMCQCCVFFSCLIPSPTWCWVVVVKVACSPPYIRPNSTARIGEADDDSYSPDPPINQWPVIMRSWHTCFNLQSDVAVGVDNGSSVPSSRLTREPMIPAVASPPLVAVLPKSGRLALGLHPNGRRLYQGGVREWLYATRPKWPGLRSQTAVCWPHLGCKQSGSLLPVNVSISQR